MQQLRRLGRRSRECTAAPTLPATPGGQQLPAHCGGTVFPPAMPVLHMPASKQPYITSRVCSSVLGHAALGPWSSSLLMSCPVPIVCRSHSWYPSFKVALDESGCPVEGKSPQNRQLYACASATPAEAAMSRDLCLLWREQRLGHDGDLTWQPEELAYKLDWWVGGG